MSCLISQGECWVSKSRKSKPASARTDTSTFGDPAVPTTVLPDFKRSLTAFIWVRSLHLARYGRRRPPAGADGAADSLMPAAEHRPAGLATPPGGQKPAPAGICRRRAGPRGTGAPASGQKSAPVHATASTRPSRARAGAPGTPCARFGPRDRADPTFARTPSETCVQEGEHHDGAAAHPRERPERRRHAAEQRIEFPGPAPI